MTAKAVLESPTRVCRGCGCSDFDACVVTDAPPQAWNQPGQPCWWVDEDLCSACTDRIDPRLTWHHGGHTAGPLTRNKKVALAWIALAWIAFAVTVALAHRAGLIG